MSYVFPRQVNAAVGELHVFGFVEDVRLHEYEFHRVNGSAPFGVDDVKPKKL
jgi:hypothetical protein